MGSLTDFSDTLKLLLLVNLKTFKICEELSKCMKFGLFLYLGVTHQILPSHMASYKVC